MENLQNKERTTLGEGLGNQAGLCRYRSNENAMLELNQGGNTQSRPYWL